MMKKNKLYTMRKGMPAMFVDRLNNNIFDGILGGSSLSLGNGLSPDILGGFKTTAPKTVPKIDWTNPVQRAAAVGTSAGLVNGFSDAANAINPFNQSSPSTGGLKNLFSSKNFGKGTMGAGLLNAGANLFGNLAGNAISGGLSSGAGNAVSTLGSTAGNIVSNFNPVAGAAVTFASNLVGGTLNRAFGSKLNQEKIAEVTADNSKINQNANIISGSSSTDDLMKNSSNIYMGQNFTQSDIGEDGWFSSKASDEYERLKAQQETAQEAMTNSIVFAQNNVDNADDARIASNFIMAHGGLLNGNKKGNKMNKFELGGKEENVPQFMRYAALITPSQIGLIPSPSYPAYSANNYEGDYLKTRMLSEKAKHPTAHPLLDRGYNSSSQLGDALKQATLENEENIRKVAEFNRVTDSLNPAGPSKMGQPLFALGGDVQMHGADFTNGLISINAGGSHETNPNEGVQLGVDPEGTPNLVEENETIFDDYVYSNRILADAQTKEKFGLPRKKDITFADISKKLEKESSERPNDPISQAGLKAQMHQLADEQERQKQEMDAQRAKAAFEALSPEEQVAVMEGAAQQEAMAEQAAMQQPSPEEIAIAQQQRAMADGTEAMVGQEPQMNCFGGRINRFDNGGQAYTKMLNSLGFHTQKEFDDWAKENSIDFGDIWKDNPNTLSIDILGKLWSNEKFKEALKKKNPALAHAFETKGYDFGTYVPTSNNRATIQSISKGNWKATNGQGWFGSEDLAFKQATEGMSENEIKALTTEQLAERMAKTDAYKNTSKWLENSDNALMYLNTLLHDPDTPDVAKKHALQYVKDGKWKDGYKYNYNDVFGKVRSTNPGTYWHTAMEANRGNEANNFVINEDGSIEPILGNVPTDWTSAGNYSWADENSDYTYNYYKRPAVAAKSEAAKTPEEKEAEEATKNLAPKRSWEGLRYAGLFGPLAGLGLQAAGVGRPDTAQLDAAVASAGDVNTADWKPLGNYLTYRPLDIWFEQNRLNANARATDRAILNSGANQGSKMAGLLAAGYNDQIASGNLFRQAQEYNDNLRKQVAEFNRGTDQFNSEQYGATSRFNADAYNNARRANAQLRLQAAAQKMDADAGWYNSLYGNVAGLFKGIADIGTENKRDNMINWMISKGIFGAVDPNDPEMKKRVKVVSAEGGKLKKNKRRGLTF